MLHKCNIVYLVMSIMYGWNHLEHFRLLIIKSSKSVTWPANFCGVVYIPNP